MPISGRLDWNFLTVLVNWKHCSHDFRLCSHTITSRPESVAGKKCYVLQFLQFCIVSALCAFLESLTCGCRTGNYRPMLKLMETIWRDRFKYVWRNFALVERHGGEAKVMEYFSEEDENVHLLHVWLKIKSYLKKVTGQQMRMKRQLMKYWIKRKDCGSRKCFCSSIMCFACLLKSWNAQFSLFAWMRWW